MIFNNIEYLLLKIILQPSVLIK